MSDFVDQVRQNRMNDLEDNIKWCIKTRRAWLYKRRNGPENARYCWDALLESLDHQEHLVRKEIERIMNGTA